MNADAGVCRWFMRITGNIQYQACHPGPMKREPPYSVFTACPAAAATRPGTKWTSSWIWRVRKANPSAKGGAEVVNWFDMEPVRPRQAADGL